MAIKKSDWLFVRAVSSQLRKVEIDQQASANLGAVNIGGENISTIERPTVEITKANLREASGRKHVRESYQNELVREFNSQSGISACLKDNKIIVQSVPLESTEGHVMTLDELKKIKIDDDL